MDWDELLTKIRAGAQWRTHASSDEVDTEAREWDVETYEQWMEDVKAGKGEGLAVSILLGHHFPYFKVSMG